MVDFSKKQNLQLASQGKIQFIQASVDAQSFPNGFFDLVTAIETIYFWPDLPKAFCEINRVLKPEGKLLVISEIIKDGKFEVENAEIIAKTHVKLLKLNELRELLGAAGFSVKAIRKSGSPWNLVIALKH
jgi:ubiquinone/menaquinone biosynthesis C-methylase UbiE